MLIIYYSILVFVQILNNCASSYISIIMCFNKAIKCFSMKVLILFNLWLIYSYRRITEIKVTLVALLKYSVIAVYSIAQLVGGYCVVHYRDPKMDSAHEGWDTANIHCTVVIWCWADHQSAVWTAIVCGGVCYVCVCCVCVCACMSSYCAFKLIFCCASQLKVYAVLMEDFLAHRLWES